jgi:hypothetical protein
VVKSGRGLVAAAIGGIAMSFQHLLLGSALLALPTSALAQLDAPLRKADPAIVVTGKRLTEEGKPIPMSGWRVAETEHVVFYARADDKQVARVARNLERLHFLLSVLLNRVGRQDDTIKLSVTQIGDGADFGNLRLGNARWQEGPFPAAFPSEYYYDPRDDGPVLATTRTNQKVVLQPGRRLSDIPLPPAPAAGRPDLSVDAAAPTVASTSASNDSMMVNEIGSLATAESRLYSGFAQHYLLTYFPGAYPRWYLDGFGQIFSTLAADKDGEIEYGRAPEGYRKVIEWFGPYKIADVLSGRYLAEKKSRTGWTPYHAWALVHLLFFSDAHKQGLHDYLAAVARGASPAEAGQALGDPAMLQREWAAYRGSKVPFEKLTYPAGRFGDPLVRQLTRDQADFLQRRLVLGARVAIPASSGPGDTRPAQALRSRARWFDDLARDAAAQADRADLQLLLAEGSCRSESWAQCRSAADRALVLEPGSSAALAWKGLAIAGAASGLAEPERSRALTEARTVIARANRADTEATLPLIAYYRTYRGTAAPVPDLAVLGLVKATNSVPAAPETRLMLGEALARRGNASEARAILLPVARGPYDTPERPRAAEILANLPKADASAGTGSGPSPGSDR